MTAKEITEAYRKSRTKRSKRLVLCGIFLSAGTHFGESAGKSQGPFAANSFSAKEGEEKGRPF